MHSKEGHSAHGRPIHRALWNAQLLKAIFHGVLRTTIGAEHLGHWRRLQECLHRRFVPTLHRLQQLITRDDHVGGIGRNGADGHGAVGSECLRRNERHNEGNRTGGNDVDVHIHGVQVMQLLVW